MHPPYGPTDGPRKVSPFPQQVVYALGINGKPFVRRCASRTAAGLAVMDRHVVALYRTHADADRCCARIARALKGRTPHAA